MSDRDSRNRFLCLGAGEGWHANQLRDAAAALDCQLHFATYESLRARVDDESGCSLQCDAGSIEKFNAILTRTMPAGTLEQVIFRLATLHSIAESPATALLPIVNPPRSLEIAIDKFATLAHVAELGFSIPETIVVQSRREAVDAFHELGGDCIVKPIFGGEGRGVMRIQNAELAWTTFWTLEKLGAVCYVQRFVSPGGSDTRLLVIGDDVIGVRRQNNADFRTNVASGGFCQPIEPTKQQITMARRICQSIGLKFASVDLIDSQDGEPKVLEVNAIPGWKGAQSVSSFNIAQRIIQLLQSEVVASAEARC
jgi:ribosomal protein S6--L-glutamate ligase